MALPVAALPAGQTENFGMISKKPTLKKIKPTREFALKHIKRMPDLYHKSQPENLYSIMRWHGHLTWASATGMGMGME
ncbi:hypothetical protein AB8879_00335 [Alphaproteobacteria bacterium LSUCC0744]